MAERPKRVTNEQVLDALRLMGHNIQGPISMTGAQNSEWKRKLFHNTPLRSLGQNFDAEFNKAVEVAKGLATVDPKASNIEKLGVIIKAFGVSGDDYTKIINEAKKIRNRTPGIYQGGQAFTDRQFLQAVGNVLGTDTPIVRSTARLVGMEDVLAPPPPPPPPAPAPAKDVAATGSPNVPAPAQKAAPKKAAAPAGTQTAAPTGPITNAAGQVVDKGLPPNATRAQVEEYFRKNYGAEAWMLNIPDFYDIIEKVAKNPSGWSQASITSAVQQKPWWQQNGQNVANYLRDQANMSAPDFQQKLGTYVDRVSDLAQTFGLNISQDRLTQLGTEAYKWNWTDDQLSDAVAAEFDYTEGQHTVFVDKLFTEARNYLVPIDEATVDMWGRRLIADPETEQGNWTNFLKEQAKSMFPSFATRLDAGETMTAISKPYRSLAAKWLEIDENDVDFLDPKWMGALDQVDDKGNHTSMSYADWTKKLMNDPVYRYDYTKNAKDSAAGLASGILQKFGVIA